MHLVHRTTDDRRFDARAIVEAVERLPANRVVVALGVLWIVVFGLDIGTGRDVSLSILYLLPIAVTALRFEATVASISAVAGAIVWYIAERINASAGLAGLVPLWNGLVRLGIFLIVASLLVALRRLLAEQRTAARVDALTSVLNASGFLERAELELLRAQRSGAPISLAYIDLDHFKRLNDSRGHAAGDDALRHVGATLAGAVRRIDVVGRLGGDEFAVLLPDSSREGAATVIDRCQRALATLHDDFEIGASIGLVTFTTAPDAVDVALRCADDVMYEVKAEGRGQTRHVVVDELNR